MSEKTKRAPELLAEREAEVREDYARGLGTREEVGALLEILDAERALRMELLDACRLAVSCLRTKRFEQGHLDEIRAVIAKTEGES